MPKLTSATVNKELKRLGFQERLVRGNGYFYFFGGNAHMWNEDSVYVQSADQLTLDQWVEEYKRLRDARIA